MSKLFRFRGLPICEGDYTRPWSKLGVVSDTEKSAIRFISVKLNTDEQSVEQFYELESVDYVGISSHGNWIYFPEIL